jgi:hypothetical protein
MVAIAIHRRKISGEGRPVVASIKLSIQQGSCRVFSPRPIETTFPLDESVRISVTEFSFLLLDGHLAVRPIPTDLAFGRDNQRATFVGYWYFESLLHLRDQLFAANLRDLEDVGVVVLAEDLGLRELLPNSIAPVVDQISHNTLRFVSNGLAEGGIIIRSSKKVSTSSQEGGEVGVIRDLLGDPSVPALHGEGGEIFRLEHFNKSFRDFEVTGHSGRGSVIVCSVTSPLRHVAIREPTIEDLLSDLSVRLKISSPAEVRPNELAYDGMEIAGLTSIEVRPVIEQSPMDEAYGAGLGLLSVDVDKDVAGVRDEHATQLFSDILKI